MTDIDAVPLPAEDKTPSTGSVFTPALALQFLVICMIWGSTWIVIRSQLSIVPVAWSVAYRFAISGFFMLLLCLLHQERRRQISQMNLKMHGFTMIAALMQFSLNFNFVYHSERYLTSGLVSLLFALLILPNAILGAIFLRQRITMRFWLGSFIGIGGLVLIFGRDLNASGGAHALWLGLGFGVASILCASVGNILQATRFGNSLPLLPSLALSMLYASVLNIGFAWFTNGPPVFDTSPQYVAGLLYLALVASVLAFILYYGLIRSLGPARAAYTGVIIPVLAMILSTKFEGYVWTQTAWAGVALALTGTFIAMRSKFAALN